MKARKIPKIDSIKELAQFWDTHDVSDFEDQLEDISSVFEQRPKTAIAATDTSGKHPFSSDRPIMSAKEDRLGRSNFSDYFAAAIRGWKGNDSLVIGLYGPWGSGKSSIKNMVLESLRKFKDDCPKILEFNPWQWAGQEQLAEAFFQEIGVVLGRSDTSKKGKERAAKWRAYGTYVTLGARLAKSSKFLFPLLGIPGSTISDLVAKGLEQSSEVIQEGSEALTAQGEAADRSLMDLKKELFEALKTMKTSLLVVMDDVDRLSTEEIKLLFQLVKANADFPNLIYLLLFQRDIVEKSLDAVAPITGREFLEKIIQVGFDVPLIERPRLERVLFAGLDELLGQKTIRRRFNQQRWQNVFISGLRPYFETLRDVHRYLAMLSFHVSLFQENGSFNVNPIDLIAIEALRVFEPNIYEALPENKLVLVGQSTSLSRDWGDETRKFITSIVEKLPENRREQVRDVLKELFPQVDWALRNYGYGSGFEDGWFRDLRVCHPDVFDRYFHFAVPEGDISQAELDLILSLTGDRNRLVAEFKSLTQRNLLEVVLDRLEAYKDKINLENARAFVTAIFDIGDDLSIGRGGFFDVEPDMHATRIIHWYLKQEKDPTKRASILKETMQLTSGLHLPVMKTSLEVSKEDRKQDPDAFLVTEDALEDLKGICLEKIRAAAESGKLKSHPKLLYILYRWREWASPEEPMKWVEQLVGSQEGLLYFLKGLVQKGSVSSGDDHVARVYQFMRLKSVEDFVAPKVVDEGIKQLSHAEITEDDREAIRAFQRAVKRRREGKGDDDWGWDSDEN